MVFGPFGEFGAVYVFFVLQKIKEKYFSFQGGDLASVGLSNCATKLCVKLYTGPPKYYFFFRKKLCVKCNLTGIITLHSFGVVCYCVHITERNTMPQMSKQAYNNLMQASRKYATVTYSICVPPKPRIYFKSKQALLAYKRKHNIAKFYCTIHHQF